jgi:aminoglycoside phosphotransferase (APT) family kinase protein
MTTDFSTVSAEAACDALCSLGLSCSPDEIEVIARDERWAVLLPGERIAWFPASAAGAERLDVERRVLRLLAQRCRFRVPRLLAVADRGFDLRAMVPGRCDPWGLFRRCQADPAVARRIGRSIGAILAEQHAAIREADVTGWLPRRVAWPESGPWIGERLAHVAEDQDLMRMIDEILRRYEAVAIEEADRVLVHGDVGLHNLALDAESDSVTGIFDYDSSAWADRHYDFRYLLFDIGRDEMLDAALEVYEGSLGRSVDRTRICLYNAACATSYLAFRSGSAPEERSCGRTLAEDVRWVRMAAAAIGA